MDKLIIVHYIDSRKMTPQDVAENIQKIIKNINLNDEYLTYFIPVESETRIECINPKLVSEEDYKQAREILDRNQKIVDDIVKSNNII